MANKAAPLVIVGALSVQPLSALADDGGPVRFRSTVEVVWRPGSMKPPGVALTADVSAFPGQWWHLAPSPSVGAGARVEVFLDREVRFGLEPTLGLGAGDLENACGLGWGWMQGASVHAELRPGLMHSLRTGSHVWLGASVEGTWLPAIARLRGGATVSLRRHENPNKFDRPLFREVFANVSGGIGLAEMSDCFEWSVGRPLRGDEGFVKPDLELPDDAEAGAIQWAKQAQEEHAAVAAFLRLAAELSSLSAPESLIEAAMKAAAEETQHARTCLERAAMLCGRRVSLQGVTAPLRTPLGRTALLRLIRDESLLDGLVNEGFAALDAALMAGQSGDPIDAGIHARIAAEELTHAWLGLRVAQWCEQELRAAA